MNGLGKIKADILELRKAVEAASTKSHQKDIWEKLGALSGLFSSVILGGVGLIATSVYNQHQLALQTDAAVSKAQVEQAQVLEKFWHYVISSDPREREFGYEMYVFFRQEKLAQSCMLL